MSDQRDSEGSTAQDAWQDVGRRFEALGASLSSAVRQAWDDEKNQQALREVEAGLKSVARAIADTVDEAAASPEGQELRAEAERTAEAAAQATQQAAESARPQILAALRSLRDGLQTAIDDLQRASSKSTAAGDEAADS